MHPDPAIKTAIQNLVQMLVAGRYEELARDGRAGRLTAQELRRAIVQYGRTLTDVPETELEQVHFYQDINHPQQLSFDVDLWTHEEGRSDLTLSGTVDMERSVLHVQIDDLRVL